MKVVRFLLVLVAILTLPYAYNQPLQATSVPSSKEPIRVAFIEDDGFGTMEINGGYSGYNYDYLMKVAQYTSWSYEFVRITATDNQTAHEIAEEMLERGELDLVGPLYYTEENQEKFTFGEKNYGIARHTLTALGNNNKITPNSFFLQDSLSVALVESDETANAVFFNLIEDYDIHVDVTYVGDYEDAYILLITEEVDTVMSLDVSTNSTTLANLVAVSPTPFYFATTKGNTTLVAQLDEAIRQIELMEYTSSQQLVETYFGQLHTGIIILSKEEEAALVDYPYLTVGLLKGREPYQFYTGDDAVPEGISVAILEEISRIIGVEFRYMWMDSREEMRDKIASQEIDICSTVPFDSDYELTYFFDVVLTQPYLTNAVTWLHQTGESDDVPPYYYYLADNIPFFPDEELNEVMNLEKALQELSRDGNMSLFADPYMVQYQLQKLELHNVEMQTITSIQSKICFGVGKHLDAVVVGLLNHALLHLDPFVVDEIIYSNVSVQGSISLNAFLKTHAIRIFMATTSFLVMVVVFLVVHSKNYQRLSRQDGLTKLYNAGYFHQYGEERCKKQASGGLILVDIDYFKQVNDTYGHQEGDNVIITVANTLKEYFPRHATVARLGGDEFVILLEQNFQKEYLEECCQKILAELVRSDHKVPVTLSMGGYLFDKITPYDVLYRLTDEELYKVKEKGRNGYSFTSHGGSG